MTAAARIPRAQAFGPERRLDSLRPGTRFRVELDERTTITGRLEAVGPSACIVTLDRRRPAREVEMTNRDGSKRAVRFPSSATQRTSWSGGAVVEPAR